MSDPIALLTEKVTAMELETARLNARDRLGSIESEVAGMNKAIVEQGADIRALTTATGVAQVNQERRHEEVLAEVRLARQQQHELATAAVVADASKWAALKDPKVLILSAVIIIAVLAPDALPLVLSYGGQVVRLPTQSAVEAPE